eukprot:g3123.t1
MEAFKSRWAHTTNNRQHNQQPPFTNRTSKFDGITNDLLSSNNTGSGDDHMQPPKENLVEGEKQLEIETEAIETLTNDKAETEIINVAQNTQRSSRNQLEKLIVPSSIANKSTTSSSLKHHLRAAVISTKRASSMLINNDTDHLVDPDDETKSRRAGVSHRQLQQPEVKRLLNELLRENSKLLRIVGAISTPSGQEDIVKRNSQEHHQDKTRNTNHFHINRENNIGIDRTHGNNNASTLMQAFRSRHHDTNNSRTGSPNASPLITIGDNESPRQLLQVTNPSTSFLSHQRVIGKHSINTAMNGKTFTIPPDQETISSHSPSARLVYHELMDIANQRIRDFHF